MSWVANVRALALASLLAAAPVLPSAPAPAPAASASVDAQFAAIETRPAATGAAFDVEGLNAALSGIARISFDASSRDSATGATKLSNLRVDVLGEKPMTLFTAKEMLAWNADVAALGSRMNGQRLGDTLRLFDRIELTGVNIDLTGYTNAVDDAINEALPEASAAANITYASSGMTVGRVIFSGLTLHPWTFAETEGQDESLAAIRLLSALARSFSLDSSAAFDVRVDQSIVEGGKTGTLSTLTKRQLIEGYDRGDVASMIQTGATFSGAFPMPVASNPSATATDLETEFVEMSGASAYSAISGFRISKLLAYGERGEMPPITERDLFSLGTYAIEGMKLDFGGKPVLEIGSLNVAVDQFAWLLPERINVRHQDVAFDLNSLMAWAGEMEPEGATQPGVPSIKEIAGILDRTGLGRLSGDGEFSLNWDSRTGATRLASNSTSDNLYTDNTRIEMTLPSYADLIPAFGQDGKTPDDAALQKLFEDKFSIVGGEYNLTDSGVLNAIAALTIEIARISGEDDAMLANFAQGTPESVRMFASGMLMFASGAVTQEVPEALPWLTGLSQFISAGGTFSIKIAPERPVTLAELSGPDASAGMAETPAPAELVSRFGLSMSHTPPSGYGSP